jgi:hypothetical protein
MRPTSFEELQPAETRLDGRWIGEGSSAVGDAVEQRIRWLAAERLVALGSASGGWDWLFRDPRDGRLWELTFPQGSLHGSGPRRLAVVASDAAAEKYHVDLAAWTSHSQERNMESIATIGYEGATVQGVLRALGAERVELLVDVRAVASSRRPGFAKTRLAANLAEAGIEYLHLRGLGTPADGRAAARAGRHAEMRAIFLEHLATPEAQFELDTLADVVRSGRRVCLLCFEADPAHCHRSLVAEAVAARLAVPVHHLAAQDDG